MSRPFSFMFCLGVLPSDDEHACCLTCSLDTVNAGRVAEYIAAQRSSGAQYIVVSHKPQVRAELFALACSLQLPRKHG